MMQFRGTGPSRGPLTGHELNVSVHVRRTSQTKPKPRPRKSVGSNFSKPMSIEFRSFLAHWALERWPLESGDAGLTPRPAGSSPSSEDLLESFEAVDALSQQSEVVGVAEAPHQERAIRVAYEGARFGVAWSGHDGPSEP
jgi:hypothetical protein